ncbi:MAG: hypothetical protein ACFFBD_29445 [Candidatus Hodarchaeota archaeon]
MVDVCLSAFDTRLGPTPIYWTGAITETTASQIALKSQMTLSVHSGTALEGTTDAVLPFPNLGKIGYVYLFLVPTNAPERETVFSMTYLVNQSDQFKLLKSILPLKYQAEKITSEIREKYLYDQPKKNLPSNLCKIVSNWGDAIDQIEVSVEEEYRRKKIVIKPSEGMSSVPFLLKHIRKNPDRLVRGIISGTPIAVIGDETIVQVIIGTLETFSPHANLRKMSWSTDFFSPKDADIIGGSINLLKLYSAIDDIIVVDVNSGKIQGGEPCRFCKKLLDKTRKLDHQAAEQLITEEILDLVSKANNLIETASFEQDEDAKVQALQEQTKKLDKDSVDLAISIAIRFSPALGKFIERSLKDKFQNWMSSL